MDRLITHLLVQSVHVSLWLEGGSQGAGLESVVLVEGMGAMGVAEAVVALEAVVEVLENWMAHFGVCSMCYGGRYVEIYCMPV